MKLAYFQEPGYRGRLERAAGSIEGKIRGARHTHRLPIKQTHGKTTIVVQEEEVIDGKKFGGMFRKGEKVATVALIGKNWKEARTALNEFRAKLPKLLQDGIVGIYADTVNGKIVKILTTRYGFSAIKLSLANGMQARAKYAEGVVRAGFPARHLFGKPTRLVLRIDEDARQRLNRP
ncbi:MAG TPA: hypothetical protein VJH23_01820 [archaeon]|nr:hypothetical protein [archaeon]